MKKILFILLFIPCLSKASNGPLYQHADAEDQREFQNIYDDISNGAGLQNGGTISSATINTLIVTNPVSLKGVTDGSAASSGYVGEYIESVVGLVVAPTSTQLGDITSISLTAGDWDVSAATEWTSNGATWTNCLLGISTTSGNSVSGLTLGSNYLSSTWVSSSITPLSIPYSIPPYRMSLATTTTIYLKYGSSYSILTPQTNGSRLSARRVR